MEISGPKINNFVNLDSELLETGTSTKVKQTDNVLPIGVEVKKFSTNNEYGSPFIIYLFTKYLKMKIRNQLYTNMLYLYKKQRQN